MKHPPAIFWLSLMLAFQLSAADPVFSGPQPGEATTPFKSVEIIGAEAGQERDVVTLNNGAPTLLVFVHGIERSILPLMRALDDYGAKFKDRLKTDFVFLAAERVGGMEKYAPALNSIKLKGRATLSLDGAEGPGNYGLNKECLLTIIAAKDNKAQASFALVQPGIADAERVIGAVAKMIGDEKPPTAAEISATQPQRGGMTPENGKRPMAQGKDPFPGAVPTDDKLQSMLRRYIRKENDDATIDRMLQDVRDYIKDNDELKKQAADGWTRILHFKDVYGTPYAVKQGQAFLEELKKP
ncbi:MAG: hypothetical protein K9N47_03160 [Prosthecobacter sp.]|uniref:hypothetical protein n=1 Tax=Prosthecobacter sp. TaxID=1965333 RepID=UPI0025DF7186|nr:hypothetical protein [Prosthecobacter sp.]MCF7785091.1 hypothetical protein [Prosthecobacter sp.]